MLIKQDILRKIVAGEIKTVFRRWQKPTVRTGGTLKTRAGVLRIEQVEAIEADSISAADLTAAAYSSREELLSQLGRREGAIYRIRLCYEGEDPRVALRSDSHLSAEDIRELRQKLARLDQSKRHGRWTLQYLELIRRHPGTRALELARLVDIDKPTFKANVRKLKELGLTESLRPGYRLSPRGAAALGFFSAASRAEEG